MQTKRTLCRTLIRRIRIMREMRMNTYQVVTLLRATFKARHA
jgi:hypothetical protein